MKKWIDLTTQAQRHVDRGLDLGGVAEEDFKRFLYSSNYYRVSGYARCFYENGQDHYTPGTTAQQIMDIYDLDRRIRNMVLDGIGVVEPTLRSRVAFHISNILGAGSGYLERDFYLPDAPEPDPLDSAHSRWESEIDTREAVLDSFHRLEDRDEIFIQHHVNKNEPVPFWAIIEVVSMGTFSKFLNAFRDKTQLQTVTKSLELEDERKLLQAVRNLTFLRNIAAHHGRLWNRRLSGHVTLPGIALATKHKGTYINSRTPAALLHLLAGLVDKIEGSSDYSSHLFSLVNSSAEYSLGCYRPIL